MGKLDTTSTVTLVINGEQSKTSLKEITSALNEVRAARSRMNQEEDPARYQQLINQERALTAAQKERRMEVMAGTEAQKGFFSDFKKGFDQIGEMAGKITAGTLIYQGVTAAIGAIKDIWNGSEQAFMEAEKTQAQLAAVLKSTGGAAGMQKDQLLKLQQVLMDKTGVDDDVIAKGEEMLLTFTNVGGKIYEKAMPAIVDYTSAMNGGKVSMEGIQTASIAVGKALNDPINGMTSLRKVGVTFNDQQKEQIKTMQQSGDLMGAQTIILNELQKEFGGTAEAIRNTSSGALEAFNTDLGNLQERIGAWIVQGKGMWASLFDPLVKSLADTRTEAEKLTDEFNDQAGKVKNLETNTGPLINRYQELQAKGKLNKDEQKELKSVIGQLADAIPSAVTQWDKYGNAMSINAGKAKQFIDAQRALLQLNNKDAIEAQIKARNEITAQRNDLLSMLRSGKTTQFIAGGSTGQGTQITRDLTDKEIADIRNKLKSLTMDTKKIDDTVRGLTGSYMDDVAKKADATTKVIKKLSEMTVGEIQDKVKALNAALTDTVVGSKAYNDITKQIAEAEKILQQEKKDKNPNGQSAEQKKLEAFNKDLESTRTQMDQLAANARKGTVDDLDAQIKLIEDKYKKVIDQINKLLKDPHASVAIKKELRGRLDALTADENLDKQNTTDAFKKRQEENAKKSTEDEFKASSDRIDNIYADANADLNENQNAELNAVTGSNPAVVEAQRLNIKQLYAQKTYELEQKHLESLKDLYQVYGKDTGKLDKAIADNTIKENERAAKEKLAKDKAYNDAKKELSKMEMDAIQQGAQFLESVLDKRSAMYAAALIVDKAMAAASVVIHTQEAIIAFAASVAGLGPVGVGMAAAYTTMAHIQEGIALVSIAAQTVGQLKANKKAAKGALIPEGPSHGDGGINLVNNKTGEPIAEMEGGEPIMILSKNTYANNRMLVNELLYNSQFRNGAPVSVNTALATRPAAGMYRDGGYISNSTSKTAPAYSAPTSTDQPNRLDRIEAAIEDLHGIVHKEASKPVILSRRVMAQDDAKQVAMENRVNA